MWFVATGLAQASHIFLSAQKVLWTALLEVVGTGRVKARSVSAAGSQAPGMQ